MSNGNEYDDIICRLEKLREHYEYLARHAELDSEYDKDVEALSLGIQALEALDEILPMAKRVCMFCTHHETSRRKEPCYSCMQYGAPNWEFRWPLTKGDTAKEVKR
ncbi:MAG: hypothetical protein LUG64_02180 [Clostridiales bacterium]|nr:hypothetical protein [Clostridiales bacterium]